MCRLIYSIIIAAAMFAGCKKATDVHDLGKPEIDGAQGLVRPSPKIPTTLSFECIGSFETLYGLLGINSFPVKQVILEDGTVIEPDGTELEVDYAFQRPTTGNSKFDSLLWIRFREGTLIRTHHSRVWSLGCPANTIGYGPFTNLKVRGRTYEINTSFTWTAPPYDSTSPRIRYLVIE